MKHIRPYGIFEASAAAAPAPLTQEQIEWLNQCTKGTWKLNPQTGLVDVDGNFDCKEQGLADFKGVRFGVVGGYFSCEDNLLTSLVGAPQEVRGYFSCGDNQLTSLVGAPQKVEGDFDCHENLLTSLVGAPQEVGRDFDCDNNRLTSLEGAPQDVGVSFDCDNNRLTSLVGAPREVGGIFRCENNQLTSLEGAPQKVGVGRSFYCSDNPVSDETLESIFGIMETGKGYLESVESLWPEIPVDDQALLYRPEFKWVGAEEAKKLQAVGRFNKIKGML